MAASYAIALRRKINPIEQKMSQNMGSADHLFIDWTGVSNIRALANSNVRIEFLRICFTR